MDDQTIRDVQDSVHLLARRRIRAWMNQEREYAESKWPDETPILVGESAMPWEGWIGQYVTRAATLGLDTERGRVALAKGIMTATRILEQAVVSHGGLPRGGVSS